MKPTMPQPSLQVIRGAFVDFIEDPFYKPEVESVRYLPDGLLVVESGKIKAFGSYESLEAQYGTTITATYPEQLILPGFIDLHVHYPQTEMIAAYGEQLLEWLNKYTFPTERKFRDPNYARQIAAFFLDELLRNGTTTAGIFTTIFPESVEVLFEEAERRQMRLLAGQVLMNRNAPEFLLNQTQSAYHQVREQIQTWHGRGRLLYALTPRFAITSTPEELQWVGELKAEFPDLYIQTHLAENPKEIEFTQTLFPDHRDYLEIYEQYGLVKDRSIFAHCIYLEDSAFARLSEAEASIAFCPTSNLFLGSGLFKLHQAKSPEHNLRVGLATDVGAGTSLSLLQTMGEAYKVSHLQGQSLSAFKAFYLATLGGAKALFLDQQIGNFEIGKEADFVVLDGRATSLMALRNPNPTPRSLDELSDYLFGTMVLGDDRAIQATYVDGCLVQ